MTALDLHDVTVTFRPRRGRAEVSALRGVSLRVERGERVALVGRSGAGKSTVVRLAAGLVPLDSGSLTVLGEDLSTAGSRQLRQVRRRFQVVFQDPYGSLHPGMRVRDLVAEPLAIAGASRSDRHVAAIAALDDLGLRPASQFLTRYPGSLSGGQRQRVAIARTLVARPELILADEPTSMLDASLRATVADQLLEVRSRLGATLVFITHDLALARHVADRIVVLREGRVVEDGPVDRILGAPTHDETKLLLAAARDLAVGRQ